MRLPEPIRRNRVLSAVIAVVVFLLITFPL
jgi:flagellin-like protein